MKKTGKPTRASPRRSAPVRSSPVAEVLGSFARAAKPHRWYLFGAQAVSLYGVPRTTVDVDVTAEVPLADVEPFVRAMTSTGFILRVPDVAGFVARTRVLPFEHRATKFPLDVVLAGPGVEELFLEAARRVRIGRVAVSVISPEHLVVTKVLAGRPKDLEDIRGLLGRASLDLDLDEIRDLLHEIEKAIDQSDLVATFEKLRTESRLRR